VQQSTAQRTSTCTASLQQSQCHNATVNSSYHQLIPLLLAHHPVLCQTV